jgi:hypothetical protein
MESAVEAVGTAVTFITAADLGHLKSLEHHLGRGLKRIHLEEFDYAGGPREEDETQKHSRSGGGMGSRLDSELSEDELARLLGQSGSD